RLRVRGDGLRDLLRVRVDRFLELGGVDLGAEERAQPLAEGKRSARARRKRDVVRNGGPQTRRIEALPAAGVVDHADDARRAFVTGHLQTKPLDQLGIAPAAGYRG